MVDTDELTLPPPWLLTSHFEKLSGRLTKWMMHRICSRLFRHDPDIRLIRNLEFRDEMRMLVSERREQNDVTIRRDHRTVQRRSIDRLDEQIMWYRKIGLPLCGKGIGKEEHGGTGAEANGSVRLRKFRLFFLVVAFFQASIFHLPSSIFHLPSSFHLLLSAPSQHSNPRLHPDCGVSNQIKPIETLNHSIHRLGCNHDLLRNKWGATLHIEGFMLYHQHQR